MKTLVKLILLISFCFFTACGTPRLSGKNYVEIHNQIKDGVLDNSSLEELVNNYESQYRVDYDKLTGYILLAFSDLYDQYFNNGEYNSELFTSLPEDYKNYYRELKKLYLNEDNLESISEKPMT